MTTEPFLTRCCYAVLGVATLLSGLMSTVAIVGFFSAGKTQDAWIAIALGVADLLAANWFLNSSKKAVCK